MVAGIKFTSTLPESHQDRKCPVQTKEETGGCSARYRYTFHEKEVSGYSWEAELIKLAKEMRKRLKNIDEHHSEIEIEEETRKLIQNFLNSVYNQRVRY